MSFFHSFIERLTPIFFYLQTPVLENILFSAGIIWVLGVLATFLIARLKLDYFLYSANSSIVDSSIFIVKNKFCFFKTGI